MIENPVKYDLTNLDTWKRFFFMLMFAMIGELVRTLIWLVTFFQVASVLLTGKANANILSFGRCLSVYAYHILLYLTFSTETLPFPFSAWNQTADLQLPDKDSNREGS